MRNKLKYFTGILFGSLLILLGSAATFSEFKTGNYKQKLSEYGFFMGDMANLQPGADLIPYDLNTPLFSDYTLKSRFIRLPEGQQANYHPEAVFDFPIGTAIIKTFYYPKDFSKPEKGRILLETRLLLHEEEGWIALPYVWNDAQTDAVLEIAGESKSIAWKNELGKKQKIDYQVPNMVMCKGCHSHQKELVPIGPTARQLNKDFDYLSGTQNQLVYWKEKEILSNLPDLAGVPSLVRWDDEKEALDARARAYLDANCGHCHNPQGPANTSGMFLDIHTSDPGQLGIKKGPIAAGRGTGGFAHGIEPGKPEESILVFRMESVDPGIMMPEMGRQLTHTEGLELIKNWIREMK